MLAHYTKQGLFQCGLRRLIALRQMSSRAPSPSPSLPLPFPPFPLPASPPRRAGSQPVGVEGLMLRYEFIMDADGASIAAPRSERGAALRGSCRVQAHSPYLRWRRSLN